MRNDILQPMKAWIPSWTSIIGAGVLAVCFAMAVLVARMDVLTAFALLVLSSLGAVAALLDRAGWGDAEAGVCAGGGPLFGQSGRYW